MKKNFLKLLIFTCLIFPVAIGCRFRTGDELTKFNKFEFSYINPDSAKYFSFLFTQANMIFIKKYAVDNNDSTFYANLLSSERDHIDGFVKVSDMLPNDSLEDFNHSEVRFYIYLNYVNEKHSVYIHSLNPPKAFNNFNHWVNQVRDSLKFVFIDTTIRFEEDQIIHETMKKTDR
jgi:hypothetical protein